MKEYLLDAINLRKLRSKSRTVKSVVPSVLRKDSPQLTHRSIISNSPLIKGRYKRSQSTDVVPLLVCNNYGIILQIQINPLHF